MSKFDRDAFRKERHEEIAQLLAMANKPGNPDGIDLYTVKAYADLENYDGNSSEWLMKNVTEGNFRVPVIFMALANAFRNHMVGISNMSGPDSKSAVYATMLTLFLSGVKSDMERNGLGHLGIKTTDDDDLDDLDGFGGGGFHFPNPGSVN